MASEKRKVEAQPAPAPQGETLGELLKRLRAAKQLTQLEVAHRARVSEMTLSHCERGNMRPSWVILRRILEALGEDLGVVQHCRAVPSVRDEAAWAEPGPWRVAKERDRA